MTNDQCANDGSAHLQLLGEETRYIEGKREHNSGVASQPVVQYNVKYDVNWK